MIRIRNPVSNIDVIINVFKSLYSDFSNVDFFDLDNIAEFFAREKLASSSGYTGDEALRRSYQIKDDSRKSMKMQAKSYTEIYRLLGWIQSKEDVALNFTFSYLGVHVAMSGEAAKDIFEQCLLGITYPNLILDVKFKNKNKPFVSILKFAYDLDGKINRDEILLGPMNIIDGSSKKQINEKLNLIKSLRKTKNIKKLNDAIQDLSEELSMKTNSVRNLTRFVISSLVYSKWFKKDSINIYGKKTDFLILTDKGEKKYQLIKNSINLYGCDLPNDKSLISEISNYSLLLMLKYADFDIQDDLKKYDSLKSILQEKCNKNQILFSPFQYFSSKEILKYMPDKIIKTNEIKIESSIEIEEIEIIYYESNKTISYLKSEKNTTSTIEKIYKTHFEKSKNINKSINNFLKDVASMKQADFYPLVADMLSFIFNRKATTSPAGNNNLRYDVIIQDDHYSIPVEVKSPTEEIMLSVKAIRQALENKIILLSRKPYPTTYSLCSIAIGFTVPNKRSDVYHLINDIYHTYKINIAIADMKDLTLAVIRCYENNESLDILDFDNYKGKVEFN
ncbi:hypothetical protein [Aliidiomarina quisquiliarum]|uniref:hypothetical protein n=1 Tax=Aliidiomarina quisquiliarum TaxID=2938947 RepID=UPI00208E4967|nr:hypothetical protein [Aliidiomarina quisquiliarum]MCO4320974.1 hypothetical protein [Aliidiomarina quisquiliarum]